MKWNLSLKNMACITLLLAIASCQKMDRPVMGDYPPDTNPPGGPLKFYAAMDGSSVDSIRANFGTNTNVDFTEGVSSEALEAGTDGYVVYPSANDFAKSTSFTISFWMQKAGPNPSGAGTAFAFGLATSTDIWTAQNIFLEFEDAGQSTADSAAAKFYLMDQWFEFIKTSTLDRRMAHVLNGDWHHLVFVYDATTSTLTPYIDGGVPTNLPDGFGKFANNGGVADLSTSTGLVVGGPGHYSIGKTPDSWMGNFNGSIDQFRLYGVALSATEVADLFAGKE
jgi:hypothetical protein